MAKEHERHQHQPTPPSLHRHTEPKREEHPKSGDTLEAPIPSEAQRDPTPPSLHRHAEPKREEPKHEQHPKSGDTLEAPIPSEAQRDPTPPSLRDEPKPQAPAPPNKSQPAQPRQLAADERPDFDASFAIGRVRWKETVTRRGVSEEVEREEGRLIGAKAPEGCKLFLVSLAGHKSQVLDVDKSGPDPLTGKQMNVYLYTETLPVWATDKGDAREIFERYNGIINTNNQIRIDEVPA
jgi:hypothetical protein